MQENISQRFFGFFEGMGMFDFSCQRALLQNLRRSTSFLRFSYYQHTNRLYKNELSSVEIAALRMAGNTEQPRLS
jgi:hypothetical protein